LGHLLLDREAAVRQISAEALVHLEKVAEKLAAPGRQTGGVAGSRADILAVVATVLPQTRRMLADPSPGVRACGAEVIGEAARAASTLLIRLPSSGSAPETTGTAAGEERNALLSLLLQLRDYGPVLARALGDGQERVRRQAYGAVETL